MASPSLYVDHYVPELGFLFRHSYVVGLMASPSLHVNHYVPERAVHWCRPWRSGCAIPCWSGSMSRPPYTPTITSQNATFLFLRGRAHGFALPSRQPLRSRIRIPNPRFRRSRMHRSLILGSLTLRMHCSWILWIAATAWSHLIRQPLPHRIRIP